MLIWNKTVRWLWATSLLGGFLITCGGCQMWRSSLAIPGLGSKKVESRVLREAKNDPFPSPSDVGMSETK